jgi:hypothetical protein
MINRQSLTFTLLLAVLLPGLACAQTPKNEQNAKALRPYLAAQRVTRLDWDLLQFNLIWAGAFSTPGSYLTSYPLLFDPKALRFRAVFSIAERREHQDPEPWSNLSKLKRESVLRGAVDYLKELLGQSFPEVKSQPTLLLVEFTYRQAGGAVEIARFENGVLVMRE